MDLSIVEGLTPEQIVSIEAMYSKETENLKSNAQKILDEKKEMQRMIGAKDDDDLAKQFHDKITAQNAALNQAQEDKLKANNDMDGLRQHYENLNSEQVALISAERDKASSALLDRDKTSAMSKLMGSIDDRFAMAGQAMLSNALNISYNDEGQAIHSFKHNGEVVADSVESFKSWAYENSDYKQILKGVDSGGAGVTQSSGATASNENSAFQQRLKASGLTQ